ncbi:MAG: helix-turn-helix transcriptional regulator [Pseudomonadota bacterium]|nr:helix-turn-helix transcriptional regulator [Pseudomonadota bacterium]
MGAYLASFVRKHRALLHNHGRGVTVSDLARRLRIAPSMVSALEGGRKRLAHERLPALASALGVDEESMRRAHLTDVLLDFVGEVKACGGTREDAEAAWNVARRELTPWMDLVDLDPAARKLMEETEDMPMTESLPPELRLASVIRQAAFASANPAPNALLQQTAEWLERRPSRVAVLFSAVFADKGMSLDDDHLLASCVGALAHVFADARRAK